MDAQQIELEIPGLPDQKNHQKLPSKKASAPMIFRTLCKRHGRRGPLPKFMLKV